MHISIVQRIREADLSERISVLVNAVCSDNTDDDGFHLIVVESALHNMESVRFSIDTGYHLRLTAMSSGKPRSESRIVISSGEDGCVFKRQNSVEDCGHSVYDFLKHYLGLGISRPLEPDEILAKYPELKRSDFNEQFTARDWCDRVAYTLLNNLRSYIYD